MPNENIQLAEMQNQINMLKTEFESVSQKVNQNNFSGTQTFSKSCIFSNRLKVPHYTSAPSVGEVGDIVEVGGTLYICTTAGNVASPAVFSVVGGQS